ncbi:MAG: AMP-binding protein, partial [Deltaproteobacteria bacterium]|nr:AMP-binding protein [Deltaproteobacteria bacterium]
MIAEQHKRGLELKQQIGKVDSVANLFRQRLTEDANRPAARRKVNGAWQDVTWSQLGAQGEELAWGLIGLGLASGEMVSLIGSTRVEWTLCDLGVMHAGGIAVPIYHSNTPDEIQFILENCGAVMVFAENATQLKKLQEKKDKLPKIRKVILMEGAGDANDSWVLSLSQLVEAGRAAKARSPDEMKTRLAAQKRSDLHTILYTSGTTGVPKGVMITNDNMIFAAECTVGTGLLNRDDSHLLFLPFAHSFAQIIKCTWFGSGLTQIFAESVDKLVDNAQESGPTALAAVPRVFEKAFNNVVANGMAQSGLKGRLFKMAMREFEAYCKAKEAGHSYSSFGWTIAKKMVFPKIQARLKARFGGRITHFISG